MFYIDNDSGVTVMPPVSAQRSAIVRWFSEGDGNNVITWPGMDWFNIVQAELLNTLEEAGIQPDKTKLNQLALSIKAIMNKNALLIKNNLSEIKTAGASAQRTARENLDIWDASLNKKGLVQLTSATDSPSETLAATAKAVKIAMDNANARLAKDRNGADIPNKPLFIQNLGLQETVNRASNAVQKNGDTLSGGLTFENDSILAWIRNTDWAKIGFKNDADGDTDSYMWFETGDNGNEYFKWRSRQSTTTKDLMTLKWDALNILVNAVINGSLGVGTTNALGGSSIVLGDNDTGFKQNGDGILDVYANSQRVFRFQNGVAIAFKNIQAGDSKKFSLSSSNTSTKNATFNLWGASTRPVVAELGDEAGWHFYSQRNTDNSVIFSVNGQIQPSNWGNFDSRYVKDVRLGTRVVQLMARGGRYEKAGHAITGLRIIGEVDGDDEAIFRPIQKYINGTWYNVAQV
ncbi:tail fiber protein [Escherichia coli]|nr:MULTISPECIES: tail fiber protein [Escherichia]EDS8091388.1 phage tail protein [Salmonella enterica subsp. enterica serovar Thompson]EEC1165012.1 phage tail protein [Salmonella enterica]EJS4888379.1 tail fiber protein [Salmonella enterica subsp. enterica serovar Muenster]EEV9972017.1 phage tail protein [Escherichia coli]EEZ4290614.1 phage tail protein [Escherichia coli]